VAALTLAWIYGNRQRASVTALIFVTLALGAFMWAVAIGGESVTSRLATLTSEDPGTIYQRNRGLFLAYTFTTLLPEYPLGAGLGRWGMANYYFGSSASGAEGLWSEIMWTGWVIDGGLLMVAAYAVTLLVSCATVLRLLRTRKDELNGWAVTIGAYSIGGIALTFTTNLFVNQMGMEFWILNAALFAASRNARAAIRTARLRPLRSFAPA
jgi:hypothetical protein